MWKRISEKYEASSDGHIRNAESGHVLKEFMHKDGYYRTQFDGKTQTVHRVIAKAFVPKIEGKDFVNHKDGNKQNNCADNLEWVTRSENQKHAYKMNLRSSKGEKNPRSILNQNDADNIRAEYIKGDEEFGETGLAKKYGVSRQTISAVICGTTWKIDQDRDLYDCPRSASFCGGL